MIMKLGDFLTALPKSKIKAGLGLSNGRYKFFTSSQTQSKFIDQWTYDSEALVFGTGGNASVHYVFDKFATSTDCVVMTNRYPCDVNLKCVFYFLAGNMHLLEAGFKGCGLRHISKDYIFNIEIPLPERNEQDKIVEILDLITDLHEDRKQQLEYCEQLVKSQFIEMFGDYEAGTQKYDTTKLGNLTLKISDGVHAKPEYVPKGRAFLSVQNINRGVIDFADCKFVSEEAYQKMIRSTHPERGDILYTKVGATYGIPAFVDTDIPFCLYVSVCLIKPNSALINPRFLSVSMGMKYIKHQADRRIKGIGVPDLHLNQIREFEVIVPPLGLQNEFVSFVEQTDKSKFRIKQSLEKLEKCYKALLQKYFG